MPTESESTPKEPTVVDRRSGRGKAQHAGADFTDAKTYEKNQNRLANVRWKLGEDPRDQEAEKGSGWEYVKLDAPENPVSRPASSFEGVAGGIESGLHCWSCHHADYLIMDDRKPIEVAMQQDDLAWALKMNRAVDPERMPHVLMLFCPACKAVMEMPEHVVREQVALQNKQP